MPSGSLAPASGERMEKKKRWLKRPPILILAYGSMNVANSCSSIKF